MTINTMRTRLSEGALMQRCSMARIAFVLLPLFVMALYAPAYNAPFLFDDGVTVEGNPSIRHLNRVGEILSPPRESTVSARPIVNLTFAIDYAIYVMEPWGYRLTNLAIHIANGWLVLTLVLTTLRQPCAHPFIRRYSDSLAGVIAILWVAHPLHTETVIYLTQRTELLMSFFYLLTLLAAARGFRIRDEMSLISQDVVVAGVPSDISYQRPQQLATNIDHGRPSHSILETLGQIMAHPAMGWFTLAVIACALGMGSKEVMVSAPLAVWLLDRTFFSRGFAAALRKSWFLYLGLALTWIILIVLIHDNPRARSTGLGHDISPLDYLRTQASVILLYIKRVFWPSNLVIVYEWPIAHEWRAAVLPGSIILLLIVTVCVWLWRRPALGFLGALFFMILAPTSSFVPIITEVVAERRMYLPSLSVMILAVVGVLWGLHWVLQHQPIWLKRAQKASLVAAVLMAVAFAVAGSMRAYTYRELDWIWEDARQKMPDSPLAANNHALIMFDSGRHAEAIAIWKRTVERWPRYFDAIINLGYAHHKLRKLDDALMWVKRGLELLPDSPTALGNLALITNDRGETDRAIEILTSSIEASPDNVTSLNNISVLLIQRHRFDEALRYLQHAIHLQPENALVRGNLARLYLESGQLGLAQRELDLALESDPTSTTVQLVAANLMAKKGMVVERMERLMALSEKYPTDRDLQMEYAAALAGALRFGEAEQKYRIVLAHEPNSARAFDGLGASLAKQGRHHEAIENYGKALELAPARVESMVNLGVAFTQLGQVDDGILRYQQALNLSPRYAEAHYNLANALAGKGEFAEALEHYQKAVEFRPDYTQAHFNMGNALEYLNRLADAAQAYQRATELDPHDARYYNNLGRVHALQNDLPKAVECFEKALALNKNFADAEANLKRAKELLSQQAPTP